MFGRLLGRREEKELLPLLDDVLTQGSAHGTGMSFNFDDEHDGGNGVIEHGTGVGADASQEHEHPCSRGGRGELSHSVSIRSSSFPATVSSTERQQHEKSYQHQHQHQHQHQQQEGKEDSRESTDSRKQQEGVLAPSATTSTPAHGLRTSYGTMHTPTPATQTAVSPLPQRLGSSSFFTWHEEKSRLKLEYNASHAAPEGNYTIEDNGQVLDGADALCVCCCPPACWMHTRASTVEPAQMSLKPHSAFSGAGSIRRRGRQCLLLQGWCWWSGLVCLVACLSGVTLVSMQVYALSAGKSSGSFHMAKQSASTLPFLQNPSAWFACHVAVLLCVLDVHAVCSWAQHMARQRLTTLRFLTAHDHPHDHQYYSGRLGGRRGAGGRRVRGSVVCAMVALTAAAVAADALLLAHHHNTTWGFNAGLMTRAVARVPFAIVVTLILDTMPFSPRGLPLVRDTVLSLALLCVELALLLDGLGSIAVVLGVHGANDPDLPDWVPSAAGMVVLLVCGAVAHGWQSYLCFSALIRNTTRLQRNIRLRPSSCAFTACGCCFPPLSLVLREHADDYAVCNNNGHDVRAGDARRQTGLAFDLEHSGEDERWHGAAAVISRTPGQGLSSSHAHADGGGGGGGSADVSWSEHDALLFASMLGERMSFHNPLATDLSRPPHTPMQPGADPPCVVGAHSLLDATLHPHHSTTAHCGDKRHENWHHGEGDCGQSASDGRQWRVEAEESSPLGSEGASPQGNLGTTTTGDQLRERYRPRYHRQQRRDDEEQRYDALHRPAVPVRHSKRKAPAARPSSQTRGQQDSSNVKAASNRGKWRLETAADEQGDGNGKHTTETQGERMGRRPAGFGPKRDTEEQNEDEDDENDGEDSEPIYLAPVPRQRHAWADVDGGRENAPDEHEYEVVYPDNSEDGGTTGPELCAPQNARTPLILSKPGHEELQ